MPKFAANLTMLFTEVSFLDRFAQAQEAGFTHVEYFFPYSYEPDELKAGLEKHSLQQVLFNLPSGDWKAGDRGIGAVPGREEEFRAGVPKAIEYALVLGVPRLNCLAGNRSTQHTDEQHWQTLVRNARFAATQLAKHGLELVVCGRNRNAVEELVAAGAEAAVTPKELASLVDLVITMLPNSPEVREVVLGRDGVVEGARPGLVLADMSSIAPIASREIAAVLADKGIEMLDALVSGGQPKAVDGTLSVMAGGKPEVFDRCLPVFKVMAASVVRVGDIGAGNVAKLANQVVVALNIAAVSEALVLAAKAGVDPALLFQAIRGGLAGSTVMEAKVPLMLDRKFDPGFRISLHIKDLNNALETGHQIGAPLPLTAAVMEMLQTLKVDGMGDCDHSALLRYFEKQAKTEVKRALLM